MKKRIKPPAHLKKFEKDLNRVFDKFPGVYGFLVENGVSIGIADEAQTLVGIRWAEMTTEVHKIITKELLRALERFEDNVEKASLRVTHTVDQLCDNF